MSDSVAFFLVSAALLIVFIRALARTAPTKKAGEDSAELERLTAAA